MLDPAPNGDVVPGQAGFRHHFFQVATAEPVPQIPPDAQNDNHVLEVSLPEQQQPVLGKYSPYQIQLRCLQHIRFSLA